MLKALKTKMAFNIILLIRAKSSGDLIRFENLKLSRLVAYNKNYIDMRERERKMRELAFGIRRQNCNFLSFLKPCNAQSKFCKISLNLMINVQRPHLDLFTNGK